MTTAIIGGGAAGVAAAIAAAERGARVLVLERNRKPLKKLGVTGNGRGNLLNAGEPVYFGSERFARAVLARKGYTELRSFFASLGVPLRIEDEGRVYPAALLASVAVDALLLRASQLGIAFAVNTRVTGITREESGFCIRADQGAAEPENRPKKKARVSSAPPAKQMAYHADRVIVTVGGSAAPAHGTDGSAYSLLTAFGHRLMPVHPALCALLTDKRRVSGLAGQRIRARLTLLSPEGEPVRKTQGELLFGEDALSGIAAMQLARFITPGACVSLDFRPGMGLPDADVSAVSTQLQTLIALRPACAVRDLTTGVFATPIARFLLREAGFTDLNTPVAALTPAAADRLARTMTDLRLPVTGTRGFPYAQVTAGGIDPDDFDPATLESRLCHGLYAAGEVLDVDGDCGGFNLMFSFASGLLAGSAP